MKNGFAAVAVSQKTEIMSLVKARTWTSPHKSVPAEIRKCQFVGVFWFKVLYIWWYKMKHLRMHCRGKFLTCNQKSHGSGRRGLGLRSYYRSCSKSVRRATFPPFSVSKSFTFQLLLHTHSHTSHTDTQDTQDTQTHRHTKAISTDTHPHKDTQTDIHRHQRSYGMLLSPIGEETITPRTHIYREPH
jgi:hypothetical protein